MCTSWITEGSGSSEESWEVRYRAKKTSSDADPTTESWMFAPSLLLYQPFGVGKDWDQPDRVEKNKVSSFTRNPSNGSGGWSSTCFMSLKTKSTFSVCPSSETPFKSGKTNVLLVNTSPTLPGSIAISNADESLQQTTAKNKLEANATLRNTMQTSGRA